MPIRHNSTQPTAEKDLLTLDLINFCAFREHSDTFIANAVANNLLRQRLSDTKQVVEVIWQKAASPPHMDRFNRIRYRWCQRAFPV